MTHDDLTPDERRWMDSVPQEVEPPANLRRAVVDRLRDAGAMRPSGFRLTSLGLGMGRLVASLVFTFAIGVALGWWVGDRGSGAAPGEPPATVGQTRFVLLLYEGPEYQSLGSTPDEIVREYTVWARSLEDSRALVLADRLADEARVIEPSGRMIGAVPVSSPLVSGDLGIITGFFIVRASSYEEVQRLAASSPHLSHGGRIIIRRIDST